MWIPLLICKLVGKVVVHRDHILPLKPVHYLTRKPLPIKGIDHPDNCQILTAQENMQKGNKFRPEDQLLFLKRMNFLKPLKSNKFYEELGIHIKNVYRKTINESFTNAYFYKK